ncbi:transposase [Mucilaginibacter sp.]|uniref:transposase n=1 Tax=Mucilaginibacter sp. TaxID=1882438 RepID=UPI0038CD41B0
MKQEKSDKGKRHPLMHRQIMMFKAWLRGIHHHCSHLQRYFDEFCYRFNRLKYLDNMFHNLVKTMIGNGPIYLQKSWIV